MRQLQATRSWCEHSLGRLSVGRLLVLWGIALALGALSDEAIEAAETWRFDDATGGSQFGELTKLDGSDVSFTSVDGEVTLPVLGVRVIEPEVKPPVAMGAVRLWLTDGSLLAGDAVEMADRSLTLHQRNATITVPQQAVSKIAWDLSPGVEPGQDFVSSPAWQATLPAVLESDLIVIRKAAEPEPVYQGVSCAILSIDAEHVTVALDEDRIPVKRDRVAGLVWLRAEGESPVAGPVVDLVGGRLLATAVRTLPGGSDMLIETAWSREITVPRAAVRRIDLAAGRTVSLPTLTPEEIQVQPFFAGLAELDELRVAFQPRMMTAEQAVAAGAGRSVATILAMPYTAMRWNLPAGVQRLRMQAEVERPRAGGADLVVLVDGVERLRRSITAEAVDAGTLDIDVAGGRRLELVVDFIADTAAETVGLGRLRLLDPRLEK